MSQNNIPKNTAASMYNAWFRKEYPELFECEIQQIVENCDDCQFCSTTLSAPPKQERTE